MRLHVAGAESDTLHMMEIASSKPVWLPQHSLRRVCPHSHVKMKSGLFGLYQSNKALVILCIVHMCHIWATHSGTYQYILYLLHKHVASMFFFHLVFMTKAKKAPWFLQIFFKIFVSFLTLFHLQPPTVHTVYTLLPSAVFRNVC